MSGGGVRASVAMMSESLEARLAAARADQREQVWVARRIADAEADRARLAPQIAAVGDLVASEKADVDRLEHGVGGFFRRLFAGKAELTQEQQELAAARLQHEALLDEQHAIDADLAQLAARATAVRGADARYAAVLAEMEAKVAQGGPHARQLAALADSDGRIRAARRELDEAIAAGRAAHDALVAVHGAVGRSRSAAYGSDLGSSLVDDLGGDLVSSLAVDLSEHVVHDGLRAQIATAQHALLGFQRECRDVADDAGVDGVQLTPLPGLMAMVARDLVGTTAPRIDDVGAEVELLMSYVATTTMELRSRLPELARAATDVAAQRAALLDPEHERL